MKTTYVILTLFTTLFFSFQNVTNTSWITANEISTPLENSLELKRQGIKVLACRCQHDGHVHTGQIIKNHCAIRKNGHSFEKQEFEVLIANNSLKFVQLGF